MIKERLQERTLTPQEVRTILKTDNKEIVELCKKAAIRPRKNEQGHTYFSYDEVKNLRKIQAEAKGVSNPINNNKKLPVSASGTSAQNNTAAIKSILSSLQTLEERLSDRVAKVIDDKLNGMDDVVVELIRCKTDNETLKQKIVDLNKEVYQLKNELNSYKSVGLGFYKKKEVYIWE